MKEALQDDYLCIAMQELNKFKRNEVWDLNPREKSHQVIGTKWMFKNKLDKNRNISKNKGRLVTKRLLQEEGINYETIYDDTYALVARLEAI